MKYFGLGIDRDVACSTNYSYFKLSLLKSLYLLVATATPWEIITSNSYIIKQSTVVVPDDAIQY